MEDDLPTLYLEYAIYQFGPAFLVLCVAAALATSAVLGRPEGRNRFGSLPVPVGLLQSVATVVRKTVDFEGRARRSELWPWLGTTLAVQALIVFFLRDHLILAAVLALPLVAPGIAAGARRLHDLNLSARWLVVALTGVGLVSLLMMWVVPSQQVHEADVSDVFE